MKMSTGHSTGTAVPPGMHMMPDGTLMNNPINTPPDASAMNTMGGMDHSKMMVKSEREFIEGMIPHHQEAVNTSREVLVRGGSTPEIKKLAEEIIAAQEKEIALMKGWYRSWYGIEYVANPAAYTPMMRDLSILQGAALDRVYLEDMVMHHMGALMMVDSVVPYIEHEEITTLSKAIINSQSREIEQMRALLKTLNN